MYIRRKSIIDEFWVSRADLLFSHEIPILTPDRNPGEIPWEIFGIQQMELRVYVPYVKGHILWGCSLKFRPNKYIGLINMGLVPPINRFLLHGH